MDAGALKSCCASAYAHPLVTLVLGESWHPGGLDLTRYLGQCLGLNAGDTVADVAAGSGASACALAQQFGCRVLGIDYGAGQVDSAARRAAEAGLGDRVVFCQADAEALPWADGSVDALICECSLCTFPSPDQAVREWFRVLRPGGRLGVSDVTRRGEMPQGLDTLAGWISCLAGARSLEEYAALVAAQGFAVDKLEDHPAELLALVDRVGGALLSWLDFTRTEVAGLGAADGIRTVLGQVSEAVEGGQIGYGLLTARRS